MQDEDAPVVLEPEFGVPEPTMFSVVTDDGCVYLRFAVQVVPPEQAGILTVTEEFVFEPDGSAASTSDSEQEAAVQLEPVQDCAKPRAQSIEARSSSEIRGERCEPARLMYLWPRKTMFCVVRRV